MRWVKKTIQYWCDDIIEEKYLGSGIRVGILDTGIVVHPDLQRRICEFRDFTCNRQRTCYDDSGHGTHVAGILAGEGRASRGMYSGIAPDTDLFIGKVLDRYGNGNVEDVLNGIQWMLSLKREKNLKIVNISVGAQPDLGEEQKKKFLDAVDEMWDADGDLERRHLVETYYDVMGERLPWDEYKVPMYHPEIVGEIEQIARKYNLEAELMEKLIVSVDKNKHYTRSNVIKKEVTRIINQEWLHQDSLPEGKA